MIANKWNVPVRFGTRSLHEGCRIVTPSLMTMRDILVPAELWVEWANKNSPNKKTWKTSKWKIIFWCFSMFAWLWRSWTCFSENSSCPAPLGLSLAKEECLCTRKDDATSNAHMLPFCTMISFIFIYFLASFKYFFFVYDEACQEPSMNMVQCIPVWIG